MVVIPVSNVDPFSEILFGADDFDDGNRCGFD
jgi:hypothetical protein